MTDFTINTNTTRYDGSTALALGQAAKLAYSDEPTVQQQAAAWGFPKARFFDRRETQAFVVGDDSKIIVAFRGTEPKKLMDWMTDADIDLVPGVFGKIHDGFKRALGFAYQDIRNTITEFQTKGQSLWFTGHSLGAALATLAVANLLEESKPVYGLYTFGQPRTGDKTFQRFFDLDFKDQTFRFVNNNDIVPRVPPREMGYSHVGTFLYFDRKGKLQSDPSFWFRLLDGVKADLADLGKSGIDAVNDHSMDKYLALLEKNQNVKPF